MHKLTDRQSEVLALIRRSLEENGYPPTRAEIAKTLGFKSVNAAEEHIKALARKGAIEMTPGASRGIRLPDHEHSLPIIGRVAAGSPILAQSHIEELCPISPNLFHPKAHFLLRVRGMSMKEAGILEGDLLAVHATPEAHNGQIIVARLDNEVTVKRLSHEGKRLRLLPENPDFAPIEVQPEHQEFVIEGLVVGVIRR